MTAFDTDSVPSQLIQKGLDLRTALKKLSSDTVILYWHPAKSTSAIAFITTTRTEILSQKNARGIDGFIRSRLLDEDETVKTSRLWWSLTVPPDFDNRIRGRLPANASQDTFEAVVQQAACWILSEDPSDE